jgi:16S rRNA (adenine1518-N6/adenine1519-N6)-dimethyltransferase
VAHPRATAFPVVAAAALLAATGLAVAPLASAQQVAGGKTIRIVVPFPPGGSVDVIARLLAARMTEMAGQNFLVDRHVVEAIVHAIDPRPGDALVEIGPGMGALTGLLAARINAAGPGHPMHVIELDRDLARSLHERLPGAEIEIHEADVLAFDFTTLPERLRVVGNLPYNISSPILFRLFDIASRLLDVHVMLQREVVERIVATPEAGDYGRLSVMMQYRFEAERVLEVGPHAFRPAPKVDSSVVRLVPRAAGALGARDIGMLSKVVQAAFGQRRKMLRNTLRGWFDAGSLQALGIDPQARAEDLTVDDFVRLANAAGAGAAATGE